MLIHTIDQIMARDKRDTYFLDFNYFLFADEPSPAIVAAREAHFAWFAANNLDYEIAAPRGWLMGDPGIYAVHFNGTDDPRVAAYAALFEDETGTTSLNPDAYQMKLVTYQSWLDGDGPKRLADDLDDSNW